MKKALYIVLSIWRRTQDSNLRKLLTSTVFKTAALNHSANPPYSSSKSYIFLISIEIVISFNKNFIANCLQKIFTIFPMQALLKHTSFAKRYYSISI